MHFLHELRSWSLAVGAVLATVCPAPASPEGDVAADQVSQTSYIDFLDNWLYTHDGDNRGPSGPELPLARDNIYDLMDSYGLTVTLEPFLYLSSTYHNVVGTQIGTTYPNQEFVIGAHYDSVSNPGADDNGSGVALVLEAARIISQYDPAYTIRYVAFSMEEVGLEGSEAYVAAHAGDDILSMISADMVAYDTGTDNARIYSRGGPLMTALGAAVTEYGDGLTWMDPGWISASDHAPFDAAGYEAVLLIEGEVWNNPYYHTQQDSFDNPNNLNFPYAVKMTRSVVGWLVDNAEVDTRTDRLDFTYPNGWPEFIAPAGGTTMRVEVTGVGNETPQPGTGVLYYDVGSGWESVPMDVVSPNVYDAVFPAADCGAEVLYYVSAEAVGERVYTHPKDAPSATFSTMASPGQTVVFEFDLVSDPGWATEGGWGFGQPTGGGGEYGGPDPTSGYTGDNVYGYNLNGDYPNSLPETHLTSDPIDCTDLYDVHLKFWRWLGVEQPTYDHAYVRVSHNGTDWTTVWQNAAEITDSAWTQMGLDISAVADNQPTVYLRWTMGPTDGGWRYCGWNIDDVQIVATDCRFTPGVITAGWSCASHGSAGDLCLSLDSVNIEPRRDGVYWLEFDVSEPASTVNPSVSCVNNAYTGTTNVTADGGTTVTVEFDPALPNQDCCEITLTGDVEGSFAVRTLAADLNLSGAVNTTDASQVKLYFGQTADPNNAAFDYNVDGAINTTDFSQIKLSFGHEAAQCP